MAQNILGLEPLTELLENRLKPYAVYIFGSAAHAKLRDESDIDIAFLSNEKLSSYSLFLLAQEAASLVHRDIDLIDLSLSETVFRAQIISTGKLIVNRDEARVNEFQIRTLKEYALLNEERVCILEQVQSRGSLYDR